MLLLCLAACTGENVDEAFVLAHGAALAEVSCVGAMTNVNESHSIKYQATLFYDGSALVQPFEFSDRTTFYSRGSAPLGFAVATGSAGCGLLGQQELRIADGQLEWWNCKTVGAELASTMDLNTDCTGFKKHLFD